MNVLEWDGWLVGRSAGWFLCLWILVWMLCGGVAWWWYGRNPVPPQENHKIVRHFLDIFTINVHAVVVVAVATFRKCASEKKKSQSNTNQTYDAENSYMIF